MKKFSLVLVFLIVLESLCLSGISVFAADVTLQGSGTEESPYLISTAEELSTFVSLVNKSSKDAETGAVSFPNAGLCAKMLCDIEVGDGAGKNWGRIGTYDNGGYYSGTFDGNGYAITGYDRDGGAQYGFIGYSKGATIKNLTIKAYKTDGTDDVVGAHQSAIFVGLAENGADGTPTTLINCAAYANMTSTTSGGRLGGLVGGGTASATNCYFVGNISGAGEVAGIGVGVLAKNCFVYGNISSSAGNCFKVANGQIKDSDNVVIDKPENCYYISATSKGSEAAAGYGTKIAKEAFESGEVAYLINTAAGKDVYEQELGVDMHPVLDTGSTTKNVDKNTFGVYTNVVGEDGSEAKPYSLNSYASLDAFRTLVNKKVNDAYPNANLCAKMLCDIEVGDGAGKNWGRIGTYDTNGAGSYYSGTFDGNGYAITGYDRDGGAQYGFIGYSKGATIKNLTIKAYKTDGTDDVVGAHQSAIFVGLAENGADGTPTTLINCAAYANMTSTTSGGRLGGLVGGGTASATNCYFVGNISGAGEVAGIGVSVLAKNCFVYGNISSSAGNCFKVANGQIKDSDNVVIDKPENCYYISATLKGSEATAGYGTKLAKEAFESGEVAYLLNKGAGDIIYGQGIGTDTYPMTNSKTIVYKKNDGTYSNTEGTFVSVKDSEAVVISATDAIAFVAQYGSNNSLKSAKAVALTAGVKENPQIVKANDAECAKVFIWNSLTDLKPVSGVTEYNF